MPKNARAETKLLEKPLDTKQILSGYTKKFSSQSTDYDDEDLKNAIKMSLIENDMNLDQASSGIPNLQYPSLAIDTQNSQDDDLKRAIELSLVKDNVGENAGQSAEKVLTAEEMRSKRLKRFEMQDSNAKSVEDPATTSDSK